VGWFPGKYKAMLFWFGKPALPTSLFSAKVFIRIEITMDFQGKVFNRDGLAAKSWIRKRYGPTLVRRAMRLF
jgi:hypothetical protein